MEGKRDGEMEGWREKAISHSLIPSFALSAFRLLPGAIV